MPEKEIKIKTGKSKKPDLNAYLEKSPKSLCPFCSGLFAKTTPKLSKRRGGLSPLPEWLPRMVTRFPL